MVGAFVEEVALGEDEVGGEEDVGAEGAEEGVEGGGGGGVEGWEGTWVVEERFVSYFGCWIWALGGFFGGWGSLPCLRRFGVVVKERVWVLRRWRQGRQ